MTHSLIHKILLSIPAQLRGAAQDMMNGEVVRYLITKAFVSVDEATDPEVRTARLIDVRRHGKVATPALIGHPVDGEAEGQARGVSSMRHEVDSDDADKVHPD